MPSTPTTKSQVQAYRFVLRRMQSALVRKDAVMLHDPMRTHSRATIVGVCIAAIGMVGMLIWGILSPKGQSPSEDGIVIGKPSGQVYVMVAEPADKKQLIPVFNLASARLLLMARAEQDSGGEGQQQQASGPAEVADPKVVDDNELRDIPRARKHGIANGPDILPGKDQRIDPYWAVCDAYALDESETDEGVGDPDINTTVIAGQKDLGGELPEKAALLVQAPDEQYYLVYRTPTSLNEREKRTVKAKVNLDESAVQFALGLDTGPETVRQVSLGLLNAIPPARAVDVPAIGGLDDDSQATDENDKPLKVGSVYEVKSASGESRFYVVHRDGMEEIKRTTADLLQSKHGGGTKEIPPMASEVATKNTQGDPIERVDDSSYPEARPEVLKPANYPVACFGWSTAGSGGNAEERTTVHVGTALPGLKENPDGTPAEAVKVSTPNADDTRIDYFYMPQGRGAIIRQATSKYQFETGPIILVSDRGVKYGIPNLKTAQGLGLEEQKPAPKSIIDLLPDGANLNPADSLQSYDTTPIEGGERPPPAEQQNAEGGG